MAIRHKRKNSSGYTWSGSDLVEGQIGLNIADGTAHMKKADGTVVAIGGAGTDTNTTYAISAETGTGGANLRLTGSDASTDNVLIASGTGITVTRTDANTITLDTATGLVAETLRTMCYNADSVTLTKGTPVYVYGAQGQQISIKRAVNTGDSTSAQTLGLVEDDITAGSEGYVVTFGEIQNMNTNGYTEGAPFYLGSTAGTITFTKPYAPNHLVYLGFVEKAHESSGRVFVKPQNGYELDELHDVNINHNVSSANKDYLVWNSSNSLWENRQLDIVNDTTPQLGGNLDVNGNSITSSGNITLSANSGSGTVVITGNLQVDGTTTTVNSTTMDVDDINITIAKGAANAAAADGGGITLEGPTTAATLTYASADDSWNSNKLFKASELAIDNININGNTISSTNTNGSLTLTPNGTGDLVLDGLKWPQADGTANYVLKTDGAGQLSWVAQATGTVTSVSGTGTVSGISLSGSVTSSGSLTLGGTLDLSAPPAIGNTTPSAGTFSTLTQDFGTGLAANAWGSTGLGLKVVSRTILDNSSSGTVATQYTHAIGAPTLTASNSTTYTESSTLYISGAPTSSTNVTQTNSWALSTGGAVKFPRMYALRTGNQTAWTTGGAFSQFGTTAAAINDNTSSGTVAASYLNNFVGQAITSTNSVTYTDLANIYIGAPTVSGNLSATNTYALLTPGNIKAANITSTGATTVKDLRETVYTGGSTTGTITPDVANGTVQKITLTGSITLNGFANAVAGQTLTLIVTQSAGGGNTLTSTTPKWAGGSKTLSTAGSATDIITMTYDGSTYWASLVKGFA